MKILAMALMLMTSLQALAEDHCDEYVKADKEFESAHRQYYSSGLEVTDDYLNRLNFYVMGYIRAYLGGSPTKIEYGLNNIYHSLDDRYYWCSLDGTHWDKNHIVNWIERGLKLVIDNDDYWKRLGGQ